MQVRSSLPPKSHIALVLLLLVAVAGIKHARHRVVRTDPKDSAGRLEQVPPLVLWAWERPENLSFIDPKTTGVAFLAKTIFLRGQEVIIRPRLQPLQVPPSTVLIAVARIEAEHTAGLALSQEQMRHTASEITQLAHLSGVIAVQVDFDAARSERDFYRSLLRELRQQLPGSTALSITALASWCKYDNWLDQLPVDEAVPMLFRMGIASGTFQFAVAGGAEFTEPCQNSLGVSTDEPIAHLEPRQRLYVFNPHRWSAAALDRVRETYSK